MLRFNFFQSSDSWLLTSYVGGLQLLHAVHEVETFLNNLRERGCNFHVLWFDDHQEICLPAKASISKAYKYYLTRAILVEHLRNGTARGKDGPNASHDTSFVFPSVNSHEFWEYRSRNNLHFVMCASQEQPHRECSNSSTAPLAIMQIFAELGYCLGFINNVELRSSKASGAPNE